MTNIDHFDHQLQCGGIHPLAGEAEGGARSVASEPCLCLLLIKLLRVGVCRWTPWKYGSTRPQKGSVLVLSEGLQASMAARTRWVRTISAGLWPVLTLSTAPLVSLLPREWPHGHCSPGLAPSGRTSSTRRTTSAGAVTLFSPACILLCCPPCAGTLRAHSDKLCLCADVPISSEEV
jgi:hypothetical protein